MKVDGLEWMDWLHVKRREWHARNRNTSLLGKLSSVERKGQRLARLFHIPCEVINVPRRAGVRAGTD